MTREEIVTALRCCAEPGRDCEEDCPMNEISREPCRKVLAPAAADLIENQQREIEALRQANEGLRFNLADVQRRGEVTPPYGMGAGHPDPIGLKGPLAECPVCGGPCSWEPETDTSTCTVCGYTPPKKKGPDGDEICRAALEAFRAGLQVMMAIEEMSELTKDLCKNGRGQENATHIAEEIADVEIMLCQMKMLFDCAGQVETFRRYKLERLAGRIEEVKG